MSERNILVAGIGNIFLGDDGFGVEVAQQLVTRQLPEGVRVVDFGIRGFDLAYALLDAPDATVLVDAMPRGDPPGTVYVLEPDLETASDLTEAPDHGQGAFQGHSMTPASVFALVRTLGGTPRNVTVVGCEPQTFGPENEGQMGLSEQVAAAVPEAIVVIERLLAQLAATAGSAA
ncbi:MAG TPA: hydrogenase maturation protease [Candidatus Dormibacteraeota bacterium]